MAPNRAMYTLFIVFIFKLSLRPRRLIHPAKHTRESVVGRSRWLSGARRGSFSVEWADDVGERVGSQERRKGQSVAGEKRFKMRDSGSVAGGRASRHFDGFGQAPAHRAENESGHFALWSQ